MNLRQRTLLSVAITLAALMAGVYLLSSNILLRKFEDLEQRETHRNLRRAADELTYQLREMHSNSIDWSNWDDTYRFMADKNQTYVDSNLTTLQLNLDMMLFLDTEGRLFHVHRIRRQGFREPPTGEDVRHALGFDRPAGMRPHAEKDFCGFLRLSSGEAMLCSVRPIYVSTGTGVPRGWVVFALRVDEHVISSLAARTHLQLELLDPNAPSLRAGGGRVLNALRTQDSYIRPISEKKIAAYSMLRDVDGKPLKVLRLTESRAIYAEGKGSQHYLLWFITATGIVFSLVIVFVLEFAALSRVSRLRLQVQQIDTESDEEARVALSGSDELSWLARVIDGMVQGLHASKLELKAKNENLVSTIQRLAATNHILANAVEGIAEFGNDGCLANFNSSFARMHGYEERPPPGIAWQSLVLREDHHKVAEAIEQLSLRGKAHCEVRGICPDGSTFHEEIVMVAPPDSAAQAGMHWFTKDISERKKLESEIQYQAYHDPLTALPNRSLFVERLQMAYHRSARRKEAIAVLFLDLDGFKLINDTLGHEAGDHLLIGVASRIQHCVRPQDTVARMGGDEFTVLLDGVNSLDEATQIASRIIESLESPISIPTGKAFVSASVGVAFSHDGQATAESLLSEADVAMYQAKTTHKPSFAVFEPKMNAPALERKEIANDLHQALENDLLSLDYQPIIDLKDQKIAGVEAFLRWRDPQRGEVPPSLFISVAEEVGMMEALGTWSLRKACLQMREWLDAVPDISFAVSVNLSGKQLQRPELAQTISSVLAEANLPPEHLRLEVAAHLLGSDIHRVAEVLKRLKKTGVKLALDDFGLGPHLISKLSDYPFDMVKIDGSLTNMLETHEEARAIVKAMFIMAESVDVEVAAEGIENARQLERLQYLGCSIGQGFVFGRPVSAAKMLEALRKGVPVDKIDSDFAA